MPNRNRSVSTSSIHRTSGLPYQPPLTPVDEGSDSDTTEAASIGHATTSSATSGSTSDQSYFHSRPVNFSRPRPVDFSPAHKVHHDRSDSSSSILSSSNDIKRAHSTGGYDSYKEVTALPSQSDFAFGPLQYDTPTDTKADFDWDASLEGIRPAQRTMEYLSQRAPIEVRLPTRSQSQQPQSHVRIPSGGTPVELAGSEPQANQGAEVELAGSEINSQTKHTRPASTGSSSWDGEDARSHHTASDVEEQTEKKPWKSSNYDVSNLTEAELKKLKKKGINPALYAEMKAARRGKGSWINPLAGNTYLS